MAGVGSGTHAFARQEKIERQCGIFKADKDAIVEGAFEDNSQSEASSSTVKNLRGHKNPHLPNTPYTNDVASKVKDAEREAPKTAPPPLEKTAGEAFEDSVN